jgi:maltose phosphorylase
MDVELQVTGHSVVPSMELAPARVDAVWEVRPGAGETVEVVKFIGIATTLHHPESALRSAALYTAEGARSEGYVAGLAAHVAAWEAIWDRSDITIEGDEAAQQAIRFNIFHLNATYRGDDARLNIGPKGFTGEKYGGASYWDTEAYCLPFFLASIRNRSRATCCCTGTTTSAGRSKMPRNSASAVERRFIPWSP